MLSPRAEAPTANPDGRSAPEVSLDTRTWRCRADTTGHWGRFRREMGLLMLHGDGRQGYSIPGNAPASCVSGECRLITPSRLRCASAASVSCRLRLSLVSQSLE